MREYNVEVLVENIGTILRKWKYTKKRLAEVVGLKEMAMISLSKGKRKPEVEVLITLEELTGITVRDLCTRTIIKDELPNQPLASYPLQKGDDDLKKRIEKLQEELKNIKDTLK